MTGDKSNHEEIRDRSDHEEIRVGVEAIAGNKQHIDCPLSFSALELEVSTVGEDLHILVRGGERPHIGCAVLAVPRPSLTGDGNTSCTSSVLNVTGHKDEEICRYLAEKACKKYGVTVVCCGGFHVDHMTGKQIQEVLEAVRRVVI